MPMRYINGVRARVSIQSSIQLWRVKRSKKFSSKMSVSARNILCLTFLVVFCDRTTAQSFCAKVDFNRTAFPEYNECSGKFYPNFVVKDYAMAKNIQPYRPYTKYYLTNNFDQFSCAESNIRISINPSSVIEAAIYLNPIGNAFVEINIYDADRNVRVDSLRSDGTSEWFILKKNMQSIIPNARVKTFITFNIFIPVFE